MPTIKESTKYGGQTKATSLYSPATTGLSSATPSLRSASTNVGDPDSLIKDLSGISKSIGAIVEDRRKIDTRAAKMVANDHTLAFVQESYRLDRDKKMSATDKQSALTNFTNSLVASTKTFNGDKDMQLAYNEQFVTPSKKSMSKSMKDWYTQDYHKNINASFQSAKDAVSALGSKATSEFAMTAFGTVIDSGDYTPHQVNVFHANAIATEISGELKDMGAEYLTINVMDNDNGINMVNETFLDDFIERKFMNVAEVSDEDISAIRSKAKGILRDKASLIQTAELKTSTRYNDNSRKLYEANIKTQMKNMSEAINTGLGMNTVLSFLSDKEQQKKLSGLRQNPKTSASTKNQIDEFFMEAQHIQEQYNTVNTLLKASVVGNLSDPNADFSDINTEHLISMLSGDSLSNGRVVKRELSRKIVQNQFNKLDEQMSNMPMTTPNEITAFINMSERMRAYQDKLGNTIKSPTLQKYTNIISTGQAPKDSAEGLRALEYSVIESKYKGQSNRLWFQKEYIEQQKLILMSGDNETEKVKQFGIFKSSYLNSSNAQVTTSAVKGLIIKGLAKDAENWGNTDQHHSLLQSTIAMAQYHNVDLTTASQVEDYINTFHNTEGAIALGATALNPLYDKPQTILPILINEEELPIALDQIAQDMSDEYKIKVNSWDLEIINGFDQSTGEPYYMIKDSKNNIMKPSRYGKAELETAVGNYRREEDNVHLLFEDDRTEEVKFSLPSEMAKELKLEFGDK